ncbi:hypothetical protein BT63DRAFT_385367 [Microthyrium microscopicum]|uniref:FK506-binding protein n=1 Tax=Microthyrium microscopicum TaxID=703497 RepID=A0A6A6UF72_9PEZI|nr:hypothetical protein BT63DRAFT_385367 [Microthyrium microscopicum]
MAALRPVSVYGLKVPPNGFRIEANPGLPAAFQITMAALDPTETTITTDGPPRATLKIVRNIFDVVDDEDEDDEDYDEDDIESIRRRLGLTEEDDEDESDEEMTNGGPSDPTAILNAIKKANAMDDDESDEELTNGVNGVSKGKARAIDLDDDDLSEDGMTEYVVCTLDPNQHYQQPINIVVGDNEECYFRVVGSHTIHLTGNFIVPPQEIDDSDNEEDEELDEDYLYGLENGLDGEDEDESEEDELDDLADPRIMEVDSEEEAPKLVKVEPTKKQKNKRAADEDEVEAPSKANSKKLKTNGGQAVAGAKAEVKPEEKKIDTKDSKKKDKKEAKKDVKKEAKKEETSPANGKKVQFAEKLEQGPTPSGGVQKGKRNVGGVTVEDKKAGTGPAAKKGDKVAMRYIGKLKDGKVFDSNKKGKPFDFKLGSGEVIKGWDVGVAGMSVGAERRITVPAKMAYGNQDMPGIPKGSELTFDLKLISIN